MGVTCVGKGGLGATCLLSIKLAGNPLNATKMGERKGQLAGEGILGFIGDDGRNNADWWLDMQFDLVFVGLPIRAQPDWAELCLKFNARARFFNTVEESGSRTFCNFEVLFVPLDGRHSFQDLKRQYMSGREDVLSVAILPQADFTLCADAFRAGADDVIAQPVSAKEFELLMKRLSALFVRKFHPESIVSLSRIEKSAIRSALKACNGQVSKTSRKLGIGRSTLYRKLEHHGLVDKP